MSRRCARGLVLLAALAACAGSERKPDDYQCADEAVEAPSVTLLPRETIDTRLEALQPQNELREAALDRLFREAGCGELLEKQKVARSAQPNLICKLPGALRGAIVVGAHYDKVAAGEGAVDNWTGAALLPSLYETLRSANHQHRFVFVGFTDEEQGLVGSTGYVRSLPKDDPGQVAAMINLDSLGLDQLHMDAPVSSPPLVCLFYSVGKGLGIPVRSISARKVGTSDYQPFRIRGIDVLSLHTLSQETLPLLHSAGDRLVAVNRQAYYDNYRLIVSYLAALDAGIDAEPPAGEP